MSLLQKYAEMQKQAGLPRYLKNISRNPQAVDALAQRAHIANDHGAGHLLDASDAVLASVAGRKAAKIPPEAGTARAQFKDYGRSLVDSSRAFRSYDALPSTYAAVRAARRARLREPITAPGSPLADAAAAIGRGNNTAAAWRAQQPPMSLFEKLRGAAKRGFAEGYKPNV